MTVSVAQKAFKQGTWLAAFKFITQLVAWSSTIIVARLLVPEDYGLMDMATVLTGYAALFSELGIGAAIIQRSSVTQEELSSIFWFAFLISLVLGALCFILAYPTAWIFDEHRVIPLTQTVSVIFLLNGLSIIPINLMKKKLDFKKIGFIEMTAGLISCVGMLMIACYGGGVWTLLWGSIIRSFVRLILVSYIQKWVPELYFNFGSVEEYLKFGAVVAIGRTFRYLFEKSDRFFAGMAWAASTLGMYSFAIVLAKIPTDKIVSLIMQVSYSAFSELQHQKEAFNSFYLNINKTIALLVLPLFVGGFLAGEELVKVFLGDKWVPIIFLFKMLCISQVFLSITAINNHVHTALGRPGWSMWYNGICAVLMSFSFYFAVKYGMEAIIIPWLSVFPMLCIAFIFVTLKKIEVPVTTYLRYLSVPFSATAVMVVAVSILQKTFIFFPELFKNDLPVLALKLIVGGGSYIGYLVIFDRSFLQKSYRMLRQK